MNRNNDVFLSPIKLLYEEYETSFTEIPLEAMNDIEFNYLTDVFLIGVILYKLFFNRNFLIEYKLNKRQYYECLSKRQKEYSFIECNDFNACKCLDVFDRIFRYLMCSCIKIYSYFYI